MQFGKKNHWSNVWHAKPVIAFLCIVTVLLAVSVYKRYTVERAMAARKEAAVEELSHLKARETELHERVEYLRGERGVEEEIRKNFDVAMPGEKVVIITGEAKAATTSATSTPESTVHWYQFWR